MAIDPDELSLGRSTDARDVDERSIVGHREVCPTAATDSNPFDDGNGLSGRLDLVGIKWHGKERGFAGIEQVTRGSITRISPAPMNDLPFTRLEGKRLDGRVGERNVYTGLSNSEKHGLPVR